MRSDLVVTISRSESCSIATEHYDSQVEALKDLLGGWDYNSAKAGEITEAVLNALSSAHLDEVTQGLLEAEEGEHLLDLILKNGTSLADDLLDAILLNKEISVEVARRLEEHGWRKA